MSAVLNELLLWSYAVAAIVHGLLAAYLALAWRRGRRGRLLVVAIAASTLWGAANWGYARTGLPVVFLLGGLFDMLRMGAWFAFLVVLLTRNGHDPDGGGGPARWVRPASLGAIALAALGLACLAGGVPLYQTPLRTWAGTSLMLAVFGLVLLEQFYLSVPERSRWAVRPLTVAVAALFVFDVYLFADALMFRRIDWAIWGARGFVHTLALPLVAVSASRVPDWSIRIAVSRQVVFRSTALAGSGLYLLLIAGAGYYMRWFGGDWGEALQLVLLSAGVLLFGVLAFSGAFRARAKVLLAKHFFAYRYDYRTEWLRVTQSLTKADDGLPLGEVVVQALGALVESPGGGLWLRDVTGDYVPQAFCNMTQVSIREPRESPFPAFLLERDWIVNLEEQRGGGGPQPTQAPLPAWVGELPGAWLIVPLIASRTLVGFVVLLTPRAAVDVNWEVRDLLKTAGRQAASYLARMQAAEALLEARKFDAFNRMSAFVVHDLKNLVAQLSLMLKNAERHKDNPEFQADMLDTVRHVEERMRGLMAQLMEKSPINQARPVALEPLLARLVAAKRFVRPAPELVVRDASLAVVAHAERLERIVGHIVQNALEATPEHGKVSLELFREGKAACIAVQDTGTGMTSAFIRDQLFKPFHTTKSSGMGIGAYEAGQYVQELGGTLSVDSEVGVGTRFELRLPVAASSAVPGRDPAVEQK